MSDTKKLSEESVKIMQKSAQKCAAIEAAARAEIDAITRFASELVSEKEGLDGGAWDVDLATGTATKKVKE